MDDSILPIIRELGGLGLATFLVIWLTRTFNEKVDKLTVAIEDLAKAFREHSPEGLSARRR